MSDADRRAGLHLTTRRGFIAAAGFGVVSLYALWAGYGAAPLGLDGAPTPADSEPAEHGGEHGAAGGMDPQEFKRQVEAFIEANKLPDGSVRPRRVAIAHGTQAEDTPARAMEGHAMHGADSGAPVGEEAPVDVYLMAYQWGYAPAVLRLEAGVPYRLRMMALDTAHGASLALGSGSRIIRLRPGALVEQTLTFAQPGEVLLYCTVYCGLPHDRMQGKIVVTEANQ